jgi:transposase
VNVTGMSDSCYAALYHHIVARRGKKRAQVAVAHSLLVAIYHTLKDGTMHHDLGVDYFEKRDRDRLVRRAVLQPLGYRVSLEEEVA